MEKILELLEKDAKLTNSQIAVMLGLTEKEVADKIAEYEKKGIIKGYRAMIDWDKVVKDNVIAFIEVKVTPQRDFGFEQLAERIMQFDEVDSVYLMSGGFDLAVTIKGKSFKEVALFVAERLAPLDNVLSTATHLVLRKYKDNGVMFGAGQPDERGKISLC